MCCVDSPAAPNVHWQVWRPSLPCKPQVLSRWHVCPDTITQVFIAGVNLSSGGSVQTLIRPRHHSFHCLPGSLGNGPGCRSWCWVRVGQHPCCARRPTDASSCSWLQLEHTDPWGLKRWSPHARRTSRSYHQCDSRPFPDYKYSVTPQSAGQWEVLCLVLPEHWWRAYGGMVCLSSDPITVPSLSKWKTRAAHGKTFRSLSWGQRRESPVSRGTLIRSFIPNASFSQGFNPSIVRSNNYYGISGSLSLLVVGVDQRWWSEKVRLSFEVLPPLAK